MHSTEVATEPVPPPHRTPRTGRTRRTRRLALAAAVSASALALTGVTALPAAADAPGWVALPNPNPADLTGTVAPLDPTEAITLRVYLAGQDPAGRVAAALAASDPHSPAYAHYLTPAEYQHRHGSSTSQTDTVNTWLTSLGMTITATTAHYLAVNATVAQADAAFNTQLSSYTTTSTITIHGHPITVTSSVPGAEGGFSVPAALAGDVATVTGLDEITIPQPQTTSTSTAATTTTSRTPTKPHTPAAVTPTATPTYQCSQYWSQYTTSMPAAYGQTTAPTQLCGYTATQMRQAYGVTSSRYTGKGATVAVLLNGHSTTMVSDAASYFASQGIAGFAPGQFTENIDPTVDSSCSSTYENGADPQEESIDVESTHITAPDAKIVYVTADCDPSGMSNNVVLARGLLDAATRVTDQHLADVATGSWGFIESTVSPAVAAAWDLTFQQGALEGITFDFSSGDGGDGANPASELFPATPPQTQFPAADPWVTAVGGTSLEIGANGKPVGNPVWGDNATEADSTGTTYTAPPPGQFIEGSGGGISTLYPQPAYQHAAVPAALAPRNGTVPAARVVPDISADAGGLWLIGYTGAVTDGVYGAVPEGGTSGSSPLIAGLEADAIQAAGHPLGFANPALYQLRDTRAVQDVTPVDPSNPPITFGAQAGLNYATDNLTTYGEDSSLQVTAGYDDATGIGTPSDCFVTAFKHP